jgi:hypothetical protein
MGASSRVVGVAAMLSAASFSPASPQWPPPQLPAGLPREEKKRVREREEGEEEEEEGREMTWHPDMCGSCGSHADSSSM